MPLAPHQLPWTGTGLIHVDADGYVKIFDPSTGQAVATFDSVNGVSAPGFSAGPTFSGAPVFPAGASFPSGAGVVAMGTGDDVAYYVNGSAWEMTSQQGTAAAPISTGAGPNVKISRTESIPATAMPAGIGANNQGNAALWASATGDVNNQAQVSALLGTAVTLSTQVRSVQVDPDACAVQGLAAVQGSGVGKAIGGYFHARRDTATGTANGAEVRSSNFTATPGVYNPTGSSDTVGLWVTAGGNAAAISGVGIGLGPGNGTSQFDVGIGFTTLGGISSIVTTSIRDDSNSANSILINGTHTVGIGVGASAGPVLIGGTTQQTAGTLLEIQPPNAVTDPMAVFGNISFTKTYGVRTRNATGQSVWAIVGAANEELSGTAAGDAVLRTTTVGKFFHLGGTVSLVKIGTDNTLTLLKDLRRSRQTPTEAVLVSGIDATAGEEVSVTLTAARLVGAPTNPAIGQRLFFVLIQSGAGAFAVTWNAVFKVTWSDTGNATGKRSTVAFRYDGTNWNQEGAQTAYV